MYSYFSHIHTDNFETMYCMVDYNSGGMLILATYCFGSEQRAHDNLFLIVQDIQHIGLLEDQIADEDCLPLNEIDLIKVEYAGS